MWTTDVFDCAPQSLARAVERAAEAGAGTIQVLGGIGNEWGPKELDPIIRKCPVPIFGGLFPQVIMGGRAVERGAVVIGHTETARIATVPLGSSVGPPELWPEVLGNPRSVIGFFDATESPSGVARALFRFQPSRVAWCGGGAGALDFSARPVVIDPDGLHGSVMVLAAFDCEMSLGIAHGWRAFGPPLLVTESEGRDLISLDWGPALEVYGATVAEGAGVRIGRDDFFALASRFPLILESFGGEGVVRDPLEVLPSGALRCAGDIPLHSTVRVATGSQEEMVSAARHALALATEPFPEWDRKSVLVFDCVSRALFMGADFRNELDALAVDGQPATGALTIGELSGRPESLLQIHNKTTVVARLLSVRRGP